MICTIVLSQYNQADIMYTHIRTQQLAEQKKPNWIFCVQSFLFFVVKYLKPIWIFNQTIETTTTTKVTKFLADWLDWHLCDMNRIELLSYLCNYTTACELLAFLFEKQIII